MSRPSSTGENPAYLTKTRDTLEIHIPDCFWYPQIAFSWEKLSPKEFHHLIENIRAGITSAVRQLYPAEKNIDRGFSRLIQEHRKKNPEKQITIIIHPIKPRTAEDRLIYKTPSEKIVRQKNAKRWMEFKELRNKINLAYELKKTGGYIIKAAEYLRCTRQQIHAAMKYHGFLRGEILIFRGV